MNNEIVNLLVKADADLDKMLVSGDSVFLLASARKMLKATYDLIINDTQKGESTDGG